MQFGWVKPDPFQQLPHIEDPEKIKELNEKLGPKVSFYKYCLMEEQKRKAILDDLFKWTPEQYSEHIQCINSLPLMKVSCTASVKNQNTIESGDILTCKLRIDFLNLKKGDSSGYVHSKSYPYLRKECWYLILTDASMTGLAFVEKLNIEEEFFEKEIEEKIGNPGPISFNAMLVNDSYKGLDQVYKIEVNVAELDPLRKDFKYQDKDLGIAKADKEDNKVKEEDSDEDIPEIEEESDELIRRLQRAGLTKTVESFKVQNARDERLFRQNRTLDKMRDINPFIPEKIKTMAEIKAEKLKEAEKKEADKKIAIADKHIMAHVRPPLEDDQFKMLMQYDETKMSSLWTVLTMTPVSGWSKDNPFFDGIKYMGNLMQNPYNYFNIGTENFFGPDVDKKKPAVAPRFNFIVRPKVPEVVFTFTPEKVMTEEEKA